MIWDQIYIGTGPIMLLDASNETLKKKKILVLEKSKDIGGAWKSININGINNLENAVHYLLPNKDGYNFLEKYLKIPIKETPNKYYARSIYGLHLLIKSNSWLGNLLNKIERFDCLSIKNIFYLFQSLFDLSTKAKSKYPCQGSRKILERLRTIIENINLNIKYNFEASKIEVHSEFVRVSSSNLSYECKKLIISHGFVPPDKIKFFDKHIKIPKKKFPRPSLHIIYKINDKYKSFKPKFSQVLFSKSSCIKYTHELTQFLKSSEYTHETGVVVSALKHHLEDNINTRLRVIEELEKYNLIPPTKYRKETSFFWQDILLPLLENEDLQNIENSSKGSIKPLYTEELCSGIGNYQVNWKDLKFFLKHAKQNDLFN